MKLSKALGMINRIGKPFQFVRRPAWEDGIYLDQVITYEDVNADDWEIWQVKEVDCESKPKD